MIIIVAAIYSPKIQRISLPYPHNTWGSPSAPQNLPDYPVTPGSATPGAGARGEVSGVSGAGGVQILGSNYGTITKMIMR